MNEETKPFTVAGIGASAGGLEALRILVADLPAGENIAYVILQHLDPNHRSMLASLLASETTLTVREIQDGTDLTADTIFVAPSGGSIALSGKTLVVHEKQPPSGPKPSIDLFFSSLAEHFKEKAVGIILSGTGSDGARGMRDIHAAGGITMVQQPDSAKFDGMPNAAIDTGTIDLVLPADRIGHELLDVVRSPVLKTRERASDTPPDELSRIIDLLKTHTGRDFSDYKPNTIHRRISRRVAIRKLASLGDYISFAENNVEELNVLSKEILISVTGFFRNEAAFRTLRKSLPSLFEGKTPKEILRVWVPGCATGEEAYSLAILLSELLGTPEQSRLQLFGTDIDTEAIAVARSGVYAEASLVGVDPEIVNKYFKHEGGFRRVAKSIRDQIVFARHDIIKDPPFLRLDLIACRNLLIYFNTELQNRLIPIFHNALNPNGILFLGKSESIGRHSDLFLPISREWRIYRRKTLSNGRFASVAARLPRTRIPASEAAGDRHRRAPSPGDLLSRALSDTFGPPAVLISKKWELLHIRGDVTPFLTLSEGDSGLDIMSLARKGIRTFLKTAIHKAVRDQAPVISQRIRWEDAERNPRFLNLHVRPLKTDGNAEGVMMIAFEFIPDAAPQPSETVQDGDDGDQRIQELERELAIANDRLKTAVEEFENANEELQSLNEEFQSANEELQATNEELETGNEELQATNEELTIVNDELQARTAALTRANADLENILKRMGIPMVLVDRDLRVRHATPPAALIFNIMPGDRGQNLMNLGTHVDIPDLRRDLQSVIENGNSIERHLDTAAKIYELRIYPYYAESDQIDGALITFYDNTAIVRREQEFRALAENATDVVVRFDKQLRHRYVNGIIETYTGIPPETFIGKTNRELGMPEDLCRLWEDACNRSIRTAGENRIQFEFPATTGPRSFDCRITPEFSPNGRVISLLVISRDITDQKEAREALERSHRQLTDILESISDGFFSLDDDLTVLYFNEAAGRLLGRSPAEVLGKPLFEAFPEAAGSEFETRYKRAIDTKAQMVFEAYFDAEPYENWYAVRVYPRPDGISVYFQVITEQKQAEAALRESEEKFSRAFRFNPAAMAISTLDEGRYVDVNNAFTEMFGYDKPAIIGSTAGALGIWQSDDQRENMLEKLKREGRLILQEAVFRTRSGDELTGLFSSERIDVKSDTCILTAILNLTEQRRLEKRIRHKQKMEALGTLAGGVAHDFNHSLAVIVGFSEMAIDKLADGESPKSELQNIFDAAMEARDLVKRILIFSRHAAIKREPVVINGVVEYCLKMLQDTLPASIDLREEITETPLSVLSEYSQIQQMVVNLCNNAAKALPETGGVIDIRLAPVTIETTAPDHPEEMVPGNYALLTVTDNGHGIAPELMDKIFDPYFTTRKIGEASGLGLAVVQGIVRRMKGQIRVESTPDQGAKFSIYLPLLEKPVPAVKGAASPIPKGRGTLLIVDDEIHITEILSQNLKRLGYRVNAFNNSREALEKFSAGPEKYDLVITDMTMPNMSGIRLAEQLKALKPDIPVILCTGYSEQIKSKSPSEIGVDAILMKPVEKRTLAEVIIDLLNAEG